MLAARTVDKANAIVVCPEGSDQLEFVNENGAKVDAVLQILNLLKDSERLSGLLIQFLYSFQFTDANMN